MVVAELPATEKGLTLHIERPISVPIGEQAANTSCQPSIYLILPLYKLALTPVVRQVAFIPSAVRVQPAHTQVDLRTGVLELARYQDPSIGEWQQA